MKRTDNPLYGITELGLLHLLKVSKAELYKAIADGYRPCVINDKKGKKREIEIPNELLCKLLKDCLVHLHKLDCPEYNKCGWPKQNALKNAQAHVGNFVRIAADITDYYPNTKPIYVREGLKRVLNISERALDLIMGMVIYNGHIPTGAPTSTILAFIAHQELFDEINDEMKKRDIKFTLYADDITLSAKHGITRAEICYIQSVLNKHGLKLKNKKTKFYDYKKAHITGYYISQNGKLSVPYWIGNTIIKKLKDTPIKKMDLYQIKSLLGYINYQRQLDKRAFNVTRIRAIKQLKKLQENGKGQ